MKWVFFSFLIVLTANLLPQYPKQGSTNLPSHLFYDFKLNSVSSYESARENSEDGLMNITFKIKFGVLLGLYCGCEATLA